MTYTKINLYLANGIPEALSNLWYGSDSAVVEIRDAVEDAKNGKDLLNRIQKMVNIAYGKETCNPAARFLIAKGNAEVSSLTAGLWEISIEGFYDRLRPCYDSIMQFGDRVLVAQMNWNGMLEGAVYGFVEDPEEGWSPIECRLELLKISEETYTDAGHAIEWCIRNAH